MSLQCTRTSGIEEQTGCRYITMRQTKARTTRQNKRNWHCSGYSSSGCSNGYTIEYQRNSFIRYHVQRAEKWTSDSVVERLAVYLARSGLADEVIASALEPLKSSELWLTGKKTTEARYSFLERAVSILLQRVYERVPRMRYTMLSSLLRYAFNDQKRCRRLYIRTYFDSQPPEDNYRCEFCDVCHPDLKFTRQEAVVPEADQQLVHLMERLPAVLMGFQPARSAPDHRHGGSKDRSCFGL